MRWIEVNRMVPVNRTPFILRRVWHRLPTGVVWHRLPACVLGALCCVLAVALPTGCVTPRYQPAQRLERQDSLAFYLSCIQDRYPASCRLTQRILLRRGHKEIDMTGYLFMKPDGSRLALALGDMGMELFRLQFDGNHSEVIAGAGVLPAKALSDGIIGDIQHLFAGKREANAYLVQRTASAPSLVLQYDDRHLEEYQFGENGNLPLRSLGVSDGRIVREATYADPASFDGCPYPLPRKISLQNHGGRYSMEIVLLDVRILP